MISIQKPVKFLFIGKTASGKSSIAKAVCDRLGLNQVISYTTRPRRPSEKKNTDHIFITDDEVEKYVEDIAAYTEINGYKYFTTFDILDVCDVYVIDPDGIEDLKQRCGDRYRFIEIYIRTPLKIAEQRAKARGDKISDFKKRSIMEHKMFEEYQMKHEFHYHLRNDRPFDESVDKVCQWIQYELDKEANEDYVEET